MSSHHRRASSVVSIGSRPPSRPGSRMEDKPKLALSHILVHRCEFKMPKNQKYSCPRNGEMFDPLFAVWYCLIHDRDAQRRCQAFSDYQGIRCPELGERVDQGTGRKYCVKHFKDGNAHIEIPGVHKMAVVARAQTPVAKKFERPPTGRETPVRKKNEFPTRRMSDVAVPTAKSVPVDVNKVKRLSVSIPPPTRVETPARRARDTPTPTPTRAFTPMHRKRHSEPTPVSTSKPIPKPVSKPISKPKSKSISKPSPKPSPKPAPRAEQAKTLHRLKRKPEVPDFAASVSHKTSPTSIAPVAPKSFTPEFATSPTFIAPVAPKSFTPESCSPAPVVQATPDPDPVVSPLSSPLPSPSLLPLPPSPIEDYVVPSPVSPVLDLAVSTASSPVPSPSPLPISEAVLTSPVSPDQARWASPASSPLPSLLHFPIEEDVLQKARARLSTFRSHTPTTPTSPSQDCWNSTESSPLPSPALLHSPLLHSPLLHSPLLHSPLPPSPSPTKEDVLTKARVRLSSFQYPSLPASPSPGRWASASPSPRWGSTISSPLYSPLPSPSPLQDDSLRTARSRLSSFQFPLPTPNPLPLPPSPYEPPTPRTFQSRPRPSPLQFPPQTPVLSSINDAPKKPPARLPTFQFPQAPSSPAPRSPSTPSLASTSPRLHHPSVRSISHVLSRFLNTTINHEEEERQRIAAMYHECNICHESHNAIMMKKIEECGHQYRELCLQKVLRNGTSRVYNCSSCRAWMGRRMEERGDT